MKDEYTCACCGETFKYGWSDEEAVAEMKDNFGDGMTKDDCDVVCDDCYKQMFPPRPPEAASTPEEKAILDFCNYAVKKALDEAGDEIMDMILYGQVWRDQDGKRIDPASVFATFAKVQ